MPGTGYRTIYTPEQYNNGIAIADALKDSGGIPVTGGGGGGGTTTITGGAGGTIATVNGGRLAVELPSVTANIQLSRVSTNGSISGDSRQLSIANVGSANGTFNGVTIEPGISIDWNGYGAILTTAGVPYDATGTVFLIARVLA